MTSESNEGNGFDAEASTDAVLPPPPDGATAPLEPIEPIAKTRASRAWVRVLPALIVLVVLLIFVFQNDQSVRISFLGWSGRLPLSVALLASTALGVLILLILGSVRMIQLRREVRRNRKRSREHHQ